MRGIRGAAAGRSRVGHRLGGVLLLPGPIPLPDSFAHRRPAALLDGGLARLTQPVEGEVPSGKVCHCPGSIHEEGGVLLEDSVQCLCGLRHARKLYEAESAGLLCDSVPYQAHVPRAVGGDRAEGVPHPLLVGGELKPAQDQHVAGSCQLWGATALVRFSGLVYGGIANEANQSVAVVEGVTFRAFPLSLSRPVLCVLHSYLLAEYVKRVFVLCQPVGGVRFVCEFYKPDPSALVGICVIQDANFAGLKLASRYLDVSPVSRGGQVGKQDQERGFVGGLRSQFSVCSGLGVRPGPRAGAGPGVGALSVRAVL